MIDPLLLSTLLLTVKKSITLFALVEPLAIIPIFLTSVAHLERAEKKRFARTLGICVTIALLVAAFLGMPFLGLLGVSLGAMQVGGGIIVLLLAIAMVLGKEATFKGAAPNVPETRQPAQAAIVPLAIPLLAGPAAFSYVMGNSTWQGGLDLIHILVPILLVGGSCWFAFYLAVTAGGQVRQSLLDIVERIGGFILAAMAVEMIASGLRALFPLLAPT